MMTLTLNAVDAQPIEAHSTPCACCDTDCPTPLMSAIESDEVYDLYIADYSVRTREDLFCPDCLAWIADAYQVNDGADAAYENRWRSR